VISPRRIVEHFVRLPAAHGVDDERSVDDLGYGGASRSPAPSVALLAPAADAPALGSALALALARQRHEPVGLVSVWSPARESVRSPWCGTGLPASARLAAVLKARGHDARASGRVVGVRLASAPDEAASEAARAAAAAGSSSVVLVLAGPRSASFDALLAAQDLVVVAVAPGADPALASLAMAGLGRALTCVVPAADPARALAAAGLALLPSVRRALAAPLEALS
jgi:hypothetical protein